MADSDAGRVSPLAFAVALVTVGAGTAAGLAFVPVAGTYLGTLLGGVAAGLAVERRPLVEGGVAGVLASVGVLLAATLPGNGLVAAVTALAAVPPTTLLVSVALGFAVGAFGAHFGDDLRDGLTEPVEAGEPSPTVFESAESPLAGASSETDDADADAERTRETDAAATERSAETEDADAEFEYET